MSNDQPTRRPPAKSGGGGAPMGSTISIVIAIVAVVVGFVILRNINDSGGDSGSSLPVITSPDDTSDSSATSSTGFGTETTAVQTTVPSGTVPLDTTAKVVVANASAMKGAAAKAKEELEAVGFIVGDPTDAAGADKILPTTKVYYKDGSQATAQSVAQVFSTADAQILTYPLILPINVAGGSIGDATVLVMVGKDVALKPLPAIASVAPDPSSTATTIVSTSTSGA